jgi:hypothetical protein
MRKLLLALGVVFAAGFSAAAPARADDAVQPRPILVELFTSQGCSSCPPADAILGKLSQRPNVIALSLPITYWDMLGWKDTLAIEANTRRQKAYAQMMSHGGVYTPQIIVDGVADVVGSREAAVNAAIAARRDALLRQASVTVSLNATPNEVRVMVGPARDRNTHDAVIWMFRVLSQATVKIGAGENDGRTMTYRNIVRDLKPVGMWHGQPVTIDVARGDTTVAHDGVAVVVQQSGYGAVIGAAYISHPNYYAAQ